MSLLKRVRDINNQILGRKLLTVVSIDLGMFLSSSLDRCLISPYPYNLQHDQLTLSFRCRALDDSRVTVDNNVVGLLDEQDVISLLVYIYERWWERSKNKLVARVTSDASSALLDLVLRTVSMTLDAKSSATNSTYNIDYVLGVEYYQSKDRSA